MNCFLVTTYDRPRSCEKLVLELTKFGDVYVLDDGSEQEYNLVTSKHTIYYHKQAHLGKELYTETVNNLFSMPQKPYKYYFMCPDDMFPVEDFTGKAFRIWNGIKDPRKICLTIYLSVSRHGVPCWTNFMPVEFDNYWMTQWTDMCFMCEKRFFEAMGPIPYSETNWRRRPTMGSGVGALISNRLCKNGWNLYQVKKSLFDVEPEAHISKMNPWRMRNDPINIPIL